MPLQPMTVTSAVCNTRGSATAERPQDSPCLQIRAMFNEVRDLKRFQSAKVIFKVIQGQ